MGVKEKALVIIVMWCQENIKASTMTEVCMFSWWCTKQRCQGGRHIPPPPCFIKQDGSYTKCVHADNLLWCTAAPITAGGCLRLVKHCTVMKLNLQNSTDRSKQVCYLRTTYCLFQSDPFWCLMSAKPWSERSLKAIRSWKKAQDVLMWEYLWICSFFVTLSNLVRCARHSFAFAFLGGQQPISCFTSTVDNG